MSEARSVHRLKGLEPDNFLAFMALLGLLRALEAAEPTWRPRVFWDFDTPPCRPVLALPEPRTRAEIATAACAGAAALAAAHDFDRADLSYGAAEAADLLDAAADAPVRRALVDALMTDGATKETDDKILPTPLCFLFGQGHQHFLTRLSDVPQGVLPKKLAKKKPRPNLNAPDYVARALFEPWTREDPTDGLRWDPAEDRRYALRANDPSGDPAGQQHGANRLAAIALPLLAGAAVARRGEAKFLSLGTSYAASRDIAISWPLWRRPARLAGVLALMAHPACHASSVDREVMGRLAVAQIMRASRISVGKFFNVTVARPAE